MITPYWDPVPTARRLLALEGSPYATFGTPVFQGEWANRNWRNVPGPFYGADTDCMQFGRDHARDHVAFDDFHEFVFRQPVNERETEALVTAAGWELYNNYAWDGDDHWTPEGVRAWWRERGRVREWAVAAAAEWSSYAENPEYVPHYHDAADGHRDFVAYIDDGLEAYLRGYLFWLDLRREPAPGEALPRL
ncbi:MULTISPECIES: ferredoxin [unclassified Streptomyces]|uniref:ferredoxin n=1 Tax=unclassified Streptomyces TaxID=2593676 RepID=UPI000A53FE77|nr:ferredoxin [Streptomyces sp. NRRL F-2747]